MGFLSTHFTSFSKPRTCATIWIKHLGIVIVASSKGVASSRIKHGDWFVLALESTISGLMILGIFDGSRNNNCIGFMIVDAYELHLGDNNSLQQVY